MTASTGSRGRGRPTLVDRDSIVSAAIKLGFSNLTMTTLAETLGVNYSTLYRHVSSRQEVVEAAIDHIFRTTKWPTPGQDWQQHVRDYAATLMEVYLNNAGIVAELNRIRRPPDGSMKALNAFRTALLNFHFSPQDAVLLSELVMQLARGVYDFRRTEEGISLTEEDVRQEMRTRLQDVARGADARIRDALIAYHANDARRSFDAKLEHILLGFNPQLR